jgi:hypothetical protein
MLSSSLALPGPLRAPDFKTMLTLSRAMPGTVPRTNFQSTHSDIARLGRVAPVRYLLLDGELHNLRRALVEMRSKDVAEGDRADA